MKKRQQQLFSKLISSNLIRIGKLDSNSGITVFSPLDDLHDKTEEEISEYLILNMDQLAFSTNSMGRVIFTINDNLDFLQIKGIDSKLTNNLDNNYVKYLLGDENSDYPFCLVDFGDHQQYRFRGSMSKDEIIREMNCNTMLQRIGIITSDELRKSVIFDQNQCDVLKLPRPGETFIDYLNRLHYIIDIKDKNLYYQQFMFGQMQREQNNIFRVSDLQQALNNKDLKKIQLMFQFSVFQFGKELDKELDLNSYLDNFCHLLGNQVGTLIDNMIINYNPVSNQDITLSTELCDDQFYQFTLDSTKNDSNYYVHGPNRKQQIYLQIYTFANSIKVLIDALELLDVSKKDIMIDRYLDSLVERISINKNNIHLLLSFMNELQNESIVDSFIRVNENEELNQQINTSCSPNKEFYEEIKNKLKGRLLPLVTKNEDDHIRRLKKKSPNNQGKISISFIAFTLTITLTLLFVSMVYLLY